ncbi:MAG: cytochrome C, partial [Planctomycetota bacterium]
MRFTSPHLALFLAPSLLLVAGVSTAQGPTTVTAWNDLGMHCIDPDFSVFSLLPPYNNVHAQLVVGGVLQRLPGSYTVSYRALGDPQGSINVSSIGKTNFWAHVQDLFGVALPPDIGLAGYAMPGPSNVAQLMGFDTTWSWFRAEGIPITPIDDAGAKNPYPLMEVTVRNAAGVVVASTRTTVPTSSEMTCSECHASNASPFARPQAGWVRHADPVKDDHLNILRLHDELNAGDPLYASALADAGYAPGGLLETVQVNGVAVLCDRCHFSNALGIGMSGITPMTQAIHGRHAGVMNLGGDTLEAISGRDGCYSCHPGRDTQCLRGAMGKAIGADGDFAMQCQSCHGSMSAVGSPTREGWFDEPNCQSCHTGSATHNNGEIRYTSVYEPNGVPRQAVSALFA